MTTSMAIHAGRVVLYAEEQGTGPVVVLVHAGVADHRMWDAQMPWLAETHRTIRYDARGFGHSPHVAGPLSYTDDLIALMDTLGVPRATLVGCSFGGGTVLHAAVTHPERVERLVLVGAGVSGFQAASPLDPLFDQIEEAYTAHDYESVLDLEEKAWVVGLRRDASSVPAEVRALAREMNRTKFAYEDTPVEYLDGRESDVDALSALEIPVLVVVGDQDCADVRETADFLMRTLPRATGAVINDAAHLPSLERPAEFNRILADWLRTTGRH
ncbi:MAG: alpha/beta fold hydrolase [Thermaerobacter sp.]|nr:alpha/beta fold hydrolase [Thermaerobacter sp.]